MNAEPKNADTTAQDWLCTIQSCGGMTKTDHRHYLRFTYWVFAWFVSFLSASFALRLEIANQHSIALVIIAIPLTISAFTLRAYSRFYHGADELTQKIQLEGLKIAMATGVFVTPLFELLGVAGIHHFKIMTPLGIMGVAYSIGQILAARRYR